MGTMAVVAYGERLRGLDRVTRGDAAGRIVLRVAS